MNDTYPARSPRPVEVRGPAERNAHRANTVIEILDRILTTPGDSITRGVDGALHITTQEPTA